MHHDHIEYERQIYSDKISDLWTNVNIDIFPIQIYVLPYVILYFSIFYS